MSSVASRTAFPQLFGHSYWGNFRVDENTDHITTEIVENRNRFAERFSICEKLRLDHGIPSMAKPWDHVEFYRIQDSPGSLIMVTSPYNPSTTTISQLESLDFHHYNPIYSNKATTFIRIFGNRNSLKRFLREVKGHTPDYTTTTSLRGSMRERGICINEAYYGTLIFATPGSGKTDLMERLSCPFPVLDADRLLLQEISRQFPTFGIDPNAHAGAVLLQFCREWSRNDLEVIYDSVSETIKEASSEGAVILTGSVALMHLAEYVFIQANRAIVREGYDQTKEKEVALMLGKYIPIASYMSEVLSNNPQTL